MSLKANGRSMRSDTYLRTIRPSTRISRNGAKHEIGGGGGKGGGARFFFAGVPGFFWGEKKK